ncbi:hypothetical protein T492DRAFT_115799 [Pavlovales sp. CCMP2436]|nr:hypothetical protein T492DRAFT_115799 [Pavlovales sp. CCMP2436]
MSKSLRARAAAAAACSRLTNSRSVCRRAARRTNVQRRSAQRRRARTTRPCSTWCSPRCRTGYSSPQRPTARSRRSADRPMIIYVNITCIMLSNASLEAGGQFGRDVPLRGDGAQGAARAVSLSGLPRANRCVPQRYRAGAAGRGRHRSRAHLTAQRAHNCRTQLYNGEKTPAALICGATPPSTHPHPPPPIVDRRS